MTNPTIIVNYDQSWPKLYHLFSKRFADSLGDITAAIEHIGSTAVPGLAAKPVIDIDVLLATSELLPTAIERLGRIGYSYQGNLGIADREAFRAPVSDPPHHLEAKTYGDLKMSLAEKFREDRNAYLAGKTEFVAKLTALALSSQKVIC